MFLHYTRLLSNFVQTKNHTATFMKISAIAAIDENRAIGKQGGLLCHLPADLRHFKAVTMGSPIIMGRKTFESFPRGPLPGRLNIILTRDASYSQAGTVVCHDIDSALEVAARSGKGECFVIGGGQVYNDFAALCDELHLTVIHARFADADTFFPAIDMEQWETIKKEDYAADERNPYSYSFLHLRRKNV